MRDGPHPSLQTGLADLPHTAFQSVVSTVGLRWAMIVPIEFALCRLVFIRMTSLNLATLFFLGHFTTPFP